MKRWTYVTGATVLLVQRFDPVTALDSIRARRVTVVPGAAAGVGPGLCAAGAGAASSLRLAGESPHDARAALAVKPTTVANLRRANRRSSFSSAITSTAAPTAAASSRPS